MESVRDSKKRSSPGQNNQAELITEDGSDERDTQDNLEIRENHDTQSNVQVQPGSLRRKQQPKVHKLKSHKSPDVNILFTNADQLTIH